MPLLVKEHRTQSLKHRTQSLRHRTQSLRHTWDPVLEALLSVFEVGMEPSPHYIQCLYFFLPTLVHIEKERPPVQIVAATHNPVPTKQPTHYITSPAHQPGPTGPCYIRTSSRTPTPTSYPTVSEVYFPLHTDSMTNGSNNNALTASSTTGVAVVTINRTPGDLTPSGVNIL